MMVSQHDRDVLVRLAARVRELGDCELSRQRRELWYRHNTLERTRPLIVCFPEGAWPELLSAKDLVCEGEVARVFEGQLRHKLYAWDHIGDDTPIEPVFDVNWHVQTSDFGVQVPIVHGDNRGSYAWDPPIKDLEADFKKLKERTFSVDRAATARQLELAQEIFGDVLRPRVRGMLWWSFGLTQTLAYMVGMEQMMVAMYEQPEALHRLMAFLRDDSERYLGWLEREGLVMPKNEDDYVGSGGLGYCRQLARSGAGPEGLGLGGAVKLSDVWGFAESQETVGVSPEMFARFVMPYQKPLLEKFALNCYGCCEGLEHRFDVVEANVPRLRRVSVAPAADEKRLAQRIVGKYIYSRKVDPVPVCVGFDEHKIRNDLRKTLALAGGGNLELILKDTHTVQNEPGRFERWVRIAREEVERYLSGEAQRDK